MTGNLLTVENLKVHFDLPEGVVEAVKDVSFRIRPGSTVALVGESGSGKSVVSQAIMGILPRAARIRGGRILVEDSSGRLPSVDLAQLDPDTRAYRAIRGGRISIIFQEPMTSLSPLHTIGDQIREALHLHRDCSAAEGIALTREMLRMVGFPEPDRALRTYPFELSGGLRQRAMISMALICRPSLLIADEPTTALDVTIQAQILKLLCDLQAELGMAVLMITHDLGVVANMAEEIVVMYHGEVMEAGTLDHVFRDPRHPYLKALHRAVPRFNMKPGERLVPIRDIECHPDFLKPADDDGAERRKGEPILSVRQLSKDYVIRNRGFFGRGGAGRVRAVDDVSLEIARGECLGLVGESGCGKTTLSKMLMRAVTPSSGEVTFYDGGRPVDVLALSQKELVPFRRKLQFVFQDPYASLNPRMTVFDIITEPLVIHRIGTEDERRETAKRLMEVVGLDMRHLNRYPHSFSGGQRQRIGIARALSLRPELLICDEPVSALDVSIQAQILNLLKDLQRELGLTYLFISHNLAVVDYIADRIAVMCRGRVVELARREDLFRNPIHPYTRTLLNAVPDPDPDRRLDFTALMDGRSSEPAAWPGLFRDRGGDAPVLQEIAPGHLVRAAAGATLRELQT